MLIGIFWILCWKKDDLEKDRECGLKGCFNFMNFTVIINGKPSGFFEASRGLKQGNPFSPFIFMLVVDGLSKLVKRVKMYNLIECLSVGTYNVEISHLQLMIERFINLVKVIEYCCVKLEDKHLGLPLVSNPKVVEF